MGGRGAVALAVLLALGCASDASASVISAGGYKFVSGPQESVIDGGGAIASAECPKGTSVIAGGYETTADWLEALVLEAPADDKQEPGKTPDDGWLVIASGYDASDNYDFRATAVCAKAKPAYRKKTFQVDGSDQLNVNTSCKNNESATDFALVDFDVRLNSAAPTAGGWTAFLDNVKTEPQFADTITICVKDVKPKIRIGSSINIPPTSNAFASHDCPKKQFVISGGQSNGGGFGQIGPTTASTNDGDVFTVAADNFTASPINMTPLALCLPKAK